MKHIIVYADNVGQWWWGFDSTPPNATNTFRYGPYPIQAIAEKGAFMYNLFMQQMFESALAEQNKAMQGMLVSNTLSLLT